MIKEIIPEIIHLTKQDPGMNEYNQNYKLIYILIILIITVFLGMLGYTMILNI